MQPPEFFDDQGLQVGLLVLGHMLLAALLVVTLTRAMVALRTRHA